MPEPQPRRDISRERAPAILRDDQADPEFLRMAMYGGKSAAAGRHYAGLADRVQRRVTAIYRVPKPTGYRTGSVIAGGSGSGGAGDPADPRALRDDVRAWLRLEDDSAPTIAEQPLHDLVSRANARFGRILKRRHISDRDRASALELLRIYMTWLGRECDHRRMPREAKVGQCPDCGTVTIDLGNPS